MHGIITTIDDGGHGPRVLAHESTKDRVFQAFGSGKASFCNLSLVPGNLILLSNAEAGLLMNKLVQNSAGLGGMSTLANPAGRSMQE